MAWIPSFPFPLSSSLSVHHQLSHLFLLPGLLPDLLLDLLPDLLSTVYPDLLSTNVLISFPEVLLWLILCSPLIYSFSLWTKNLLVEVFSSMLCWTLISWFSQLRNLISSMFSALKAPLDVSWSSVSLVLYRGIKLLYCLDYSSRSSVSWPWWTCCWQCCFLCKP